MLVDDTLADEFSVALCVALSGFVCERSSLETDRGLARVDGTGGAGGVTDVARLALVDAASRGVSR